MTTLSRTPEGEIAIAPGVLAGVVVRAAESVDGVRVRRPRRGVEVAIADGRCRVSMGIAAPWGARLPEVGEAVQERVAEVVQTMLELEPQAVDVSIDEVVA